MSELKKYLDKAVPSFESPQNLESFCKKWLFDDFQIKTVESIYKSNPELARDLVISIMLERRDRSSGLANQSMFKNKANDVLKKALEDPNFATKVSAAIVELTKIFKSGSDQEQIENVRREFLSDLPVTIVAGDLSFLKTVNDKISHKAGDDMILMTSSALSSQVTQEYGEKSFLSRIGGDEFSALMEVTDDERKKSMAPWDRVNEYFADLTVDDQFLELKKTIHTQLDIVPHIDTSSSHISEGIVLYLDICWNKKMSECNYCTLDGVGLEGNLAMAIKNIVDIAYSIADRRASFRKIKNKLDKLAKMEDSAEIEAVYSKIFRAESKDLVLAMVDKLKKTDPAYYNEVLLQSTKDVVFSERKERMQQQMSAEEMIDEAALRGL